MLVETNAEVLRTGGETRKMAGALDLAFPILMAGTASAAAAQEQVRGERARRQPGSLPMRPPIERFLHFLLAGAERERNSRPAAVSNVSEPGQANSGTLDANIGAAF
jgi:hypothetical protein